MIQAAPGATFESFLQGAPTGLAGTLTWRLIDPSDASVEIAASTTGITEVATGTYLKSATAPTTRDTYLIVWNNAGTEVTEELVVSYTAAAAAAPGSPYFTVAEARAFKPLDNATTYPDATIESARDLAEQALEDACGVAFTTRTQTDTFDGRGLPRLLLTKPRVTQVQAVTVDSVAYTGSQLTDLVTNPSSEVYNPLGWSLGNGNVTVTYQHGYPAPPLRVKHAAILLTKRYLVDGPFDDRATSISTDDGTFSLITPGVRGSLFGIPEVDAVVQMYNARPGLT